MTSDPLTMLAELDRYYRKNKISAAAFACKNEKKCNAGCAPHEFVPTREAFVGPEYEKGTLPRILFISLDPADDWPGREPERRTLQAMRDSEPTPCNPGPKGRHWYETHDLAHRILEPVATAIGQTLRFNEICQHFAHTNSAKCKNLAMGTRQGKSILFQNCREFIAGEVEILRPEVIVTQGTWAREALVDAFPVLRQESMPSRPHYGYQVLQLTGHTAIKFDTAHPRAGPLFWPEKSVAYPWYVQEAHQFVLSRVQGLAPRV